MNSKTSEMNKDLIEVILHTTIFTLLKTHDVPGIQILILMVNPN